MLHNDFIAETMFDVMSPQALYFYRQISKWNYDYITMDKIYKKINILVDERLHKHYDKYYDIIMSLCKMGGVYMSCPLIAECIWGINWNKEINIVIPGSDDIYFDTCDIINKPNIRIKKPLYSMEGTLFIIDDIIYIRSEYYPKYDYMFRYSYQNGWIFNHTIFHKIINMNLNNPFYYDNELLEDNINLTKELCNIYDIQLINNLDVLKNDV